MKKILFALLIVSAVAIAAPHSASAQTAPALVKVPFQFIVGDKLLPAGSYRFAADAQNASLLVVTNSNGVAAAFAVTGHQSSGRIDSEAHAEFRKIGGQYFLTQVMASGETHELSVTPGQAQRTLAKLNLLGPGRADVAK